MKTSTNLKSITLITLLGAALSLPVLAQGGPGMGAGCNNATATPNSTPASCRGNVVGMGRGTDVGMNGGGGRGMMAQQNGARGWTLLTPEERTAFQSKMRTVKTYDECKTLQSEHRSVIEERAKDQGITLMTPRGNPCDRLKARGMIM